MPDKCFYFDCKSNYKSEIAKAAIASESQVGNDQSDFTSPAISRYTSMHKAPKNMLEKWRQIIPKRVGRVFSQNDTVCSKHFEHQYFSTPHVVENGKIIFLKKRIRLTADAIPTILPAKIPRYLLNIPKERKKPAVRHLVENNKKKRSKGPGKKSIELTQEQNNHDMVTQEPALDQESPDGLILDCGEITEIQLPDHWSVERNIEHRAVCFSKKCFIPRVGYQIERTILLLQGEAPLHLIFGKPVAIEEFCNITITTKASIEAHIENFDKNYKVCPGARVNDMWSQCDKIMPSNSNCFKCKPCKRGSNASRMRMSRKLKKKKAKKQPSKSIRLRMQELSTKNKELSKKVRELNSRLKCATVRIEELENKDAYTKLPEAQKTMIRQCIVNAKRNPSGYRYEIEWIYECILLRIKGPALYRHILKSRILPLPSFNTIRRHLRKLKATYGFQDETFELMKMKAENMDGVLRRGVLMLDEMKLNTNTKFNISTHEFEGFVNLGKYTPKAQENVAGDHGLVFMFRPFMGNWVQTIGCFLSQNNVDGETLAKLSLEAITLLENAGYFVDGIISDGASWNRRMWSVFGMNESTGTCTHPSNPKIKINDLKENGNIRKLHFFSDFPHLIKCVRKYVIDARQFQTPEGSVKLEHWIAVAKCSEADSFALNITSGKFTSLHLKDDPLLKMNVALAFQFFGNTVRSAMELLYRHNLEKYPELEDCQATITFINRFNKLIDIMNSKTKVEAMWRKNGSKKDYLLNFLDWLKDWEEVRNVGKKLSSSTRKGLKVTIQATVRLFEFLTEKHGFSYLLTDRLNQDPLEHFFGMIRSNGGLNNHPDSIQFAYLYRLMSVYSLIKPPKGSNITGGAVCEALQKTVCNASKRDTVSKSDILHKISQIIENSSFDPSDGSNLSEELVMGNETFVRDSAIGYMSGYVSRVAKERWCDNCDFCLANLIDPQPDTSLPQNVLTYLRSYGFLTYPSASLFALISKLERVIMSILDSGLTKTTFMKIIDTISSENFAFDLVGCAEHSDSVSESIIYFYITTRMFFASRVHKKKNDSRLKSKELSKKSKLVTK